MNDSILNDPGTQIDARPLIALEAMRGAMIGFCWSLLVAVPVTFVLWAKLGVGLGWAIVAMATICTIWSVIAAFAERWRTREVTFTTEQQAVLRRHIRIAKIIVACLTVPAVTIIFIAWFIDPNPIVPSWILISVLVSLRVGGYLFVLVGRAQGHASVRALQQNTRHIASRIDVYPFGVANDTPSMLVQPSKYSFAEAKRPLDESKSLTVTRLDDI